MPKPENLINKGFDKNPQNINREGRPKKIYTILKEKGYCKEDIMTAFGEVAFYNQKELVELIKDETKPIILRIIANQFANALKNADYKKISEIMEHTIGKPLQKVENDLKVNFDENTDPFKKIRSNIDETNE